MEQIHSTEVEVAAALAFPKKSKERKLRWNDLRNRGNFSHNTQVIKKGSGGIVPYRRPALDTDPMTYVPCSTCLAFFYKGRPVETCQELSQAASLSITQYEGHSSSTRASAALLPVSDNATGAFKTNILQGMKYDRISLVVRQDHLIVIFGTKMFAKNGHQVHQHQYIKQKVRELARFVLEVRELDKSV